MNPGGSNARARPCRSPPSRALQVGLLKPDFGVSGGFERVVDRVEATLRADGHTVARLTVPVDGLARSPFGLDVPAEVWAQVPEYFRYLATLEAIERIDTRRFDVVLSTQPPSFASRHPRHLSLFFHHHRIFYDLEDVYLAAGFAADPALHRRAAAHVRRLDGPRLAAVAWFLAGSEAVRARLARFGGIDRVGLYSAGVRGAGVGGAGDGRGRGAVLCVSRHEFPKRTELFVHAMKHLPERRGASVGDGGRLAWARAVDHRLSSPGADLDAVTAAELWCNTGLGAAPVPARYPSNIAFHGRVDDATLARLYREAPCVVAPAYEEDYGLTAVEAMSHSVPVVVCRDGGGLADLVDHEVDGLVVDPTGPAIAAAVERLLTDADLRSALAAGAAATAARMTWDRADAQLRAGLAEVLR